METESSMSKHPISLNFDDKVENYFNYDPTVLDKCEFWWLFLCQDETLPGYIILFNDPLGYNMDSMTLFEPSPD